MLKPDSSDNNPLFNLAVSAAQLVVPFVFFFWLPAAWLKEERRWRHRFFFINIFFFFRRANVLARHSVGLQYEAQVSRSALMPY